MRIPLLVSSVLVGLVGCAAPDASTMFTTLDTSVMDGPGLSERAVELVDGAQEQVLVALPVVEDTDLVRSLIDAHDAGLLVEVVTDVDREADAGTQLLVDAGVPVKLADDEMTYTEFGIGDVTEITVPSEYVQMSSAFLVADQNKALLSTELGAARDGDFVVHDIVSEDLVDDLSMEHNQLFGGTDASALTAFSSMAKSVTDSRWLYPNQSGLELEVWLGPQERVLKRIIDAVYTARASVYVLTDDFLDQGLAKALQDKAVDGFEVAVVVGPNFGSTSTYSDALQYEAPDVFKFQVTPHTAHIPTIVLIDSNHEANPMGLDVSPRARAFVVTHDIISAIRYELEPAPDGGYDVDAIRSDQLTDGVLTVISDPNHDPENPSPEFDALLETINSHLDIAVPL
jgi:hypothetical protein